MIMYSMACVVLKVFLYLLHLSPFCEVIQFVVSLVVDIVIFLLVVVSRLNG